MASRISALYDDYLKRRPRQSRSRSVVEAILRAASDKISGGDTGNEEDLAVQDVAERAGVGIGSLYDYFHDRQSLLSAFAAKVTEDNLRAFEAALDGTEALPLDEAIAKLVDFTFATYTKNKRVPRAVLRIAHSIGLMPTLASSQTVFAETLATHLRKRTDIDNDSIDVDLAAWTITHSVMGIVHSLLWHNDDESLPFLKNDALLRADLVRLYRGYLTG